MENSLLFFSNIDIKNATITGKFKNPREAYILWIYLDYALLMISYCQEVYLKNFIVEYANTNGQGSFFLRFFLFH
jgi:hypothetical protein